MSFTTPLPALSGSDVWGGTINAALNQLMADKAAVFGVAAPTGVAATDTAAINTAIAAAVAGGGGVVQLKAGTYVVTSGITVTSNAITIRGQGIFYGTTIRCSTTTGNILTFNGAQHSGVENVLFDYSVTPTAGYAVAFTGSTFQCFARNVRVNQGFSGISVNGATETRLSGVTLRQMYGVHGVYFGGTAGSRSYRLIIDDLICDSPYLSSPSSTSVKTWAVSTAFALNDVVRTAGGIYQAVTAGTSAGSGTGPTGGTFTTNVTDGTAAWRFISGADLAWIVHDSYAYSLVVNKAALLNGYNGFVQNDTAVTGSSFPIWAWAWDMETDHSYHTGVRLIAGEGFYASGCWFGSSLTANGGEIIASHRGETSISGGTRIMGNAQHGWLINAGPVDNLVTGCFIGDNSVATSALYHGVTAAGATRFSITGNRIGDLVGSAGNLQGYGVFVTAGASDNYSITGNIISGNVTGNVSDAGTGTNKRIDQTGVGVAVPFYTVATLPSAATSALTIYVSNEVGGAVLAFSDGTNWRRVTDRAIVA